MQPLPFLAATLLAVHNAPDNEKDHVGRVALFTRTFDRFGGKPADYVPALPAVMQPGHRPYWWPKQKCPYGKDDCPNPAEPIGFGHHADCTMLDRDKVERLGDHLFGSGDPVDDLR